MIFLAPLFTKIFPLNFGSKLDILYLLFGASANWVVIFKICNHALIFKPLEVRQEPRLMTCVQILTKCKKFRIYTGILNFLFAFILSWSTGLMIYILIEKDPFLYTGKTRR